MLGLPVLVPDVMWAVPFGLLLFPLVVLPSCIVAVFLWALLPAALARHSWAVWPLALIGVLAAAAVYVGPPLIADRQAETARAALGEIAPLPLSIALPAGIEFRRPLQQKFYHARAVAQFDRTICPELCERLLLGGDIAWIRVVVTDDRDGDQSVKTSTLVTTAQGADCVTLHPDLSPTEACLLFRADHGLPADLVLEIQDRPQQPSGVVYRQNGYRLVQVSAGAGPVLRRIQVFHDRPTFLGLSRQRTATEPPDLLQDLATLGLTMAPPLARTPRPPFWKRSVFLKMPPEPQDTAYVRSLLTAWPDTRFSIAYTLFVAAWQEALANSESLTETEVSTFCAILRDPRLARMNSSQVSEGPSINCPKVLPPG